jgi:hypothetical protein
MTYPANLYRYRRISDFTLDELRRGKVYLANPDDFNDPFDARLNYEVDVSVEDFRRWFHRQAATDPELPLDQRLAFFLQGEEILAKAGGRLPPIYQDMIARAAEEAVERARQRGIMCLCEEADNILLWSHYAANHSGVCIEYDLGKLQGVEPALHRVVYTTKFPRLRVSDVLSDNPSQRFDEILATKHMCWSYEREWRIITEPTGERYFGLPITRVILGIRTTAADKQKVEVALAGKAGIWIAQASLSKDEYRVEISDVGKTT